MLGAVIADAGCATVGNASRRERRDNRQPMQQYKTSCNINQVMRDGNNSDTFEAACIALGMPELHEGQELSIAD